MAAPELKWATEQRFQYVEYQAFWLGSLNRADLTAQFGISIPQASKDLAAYQAMFPRNIRYDHSEKRYFTTEDFCPKFIELNSDKFLSGLLENGGTKSVHCDLFSERVLIPPRKIDPYVLQSIVECITSSRSIEILYQSMNSEKPDPLWRRITPHSFATDGLRWHVRAYCHIDGKFKDFLLSRCLESRDPSDAGAVRDDDSHWNELFDVRLIPNPELSQHQQEVIKIDYGMVDGALEMCIRRAMLYYFKKRLRLDVAHIVDEPGECPVVIANKEAFEKALEEAAK